MVLGDCGEMVRFSALSNRVIGFAIEVHREQRPGLLEATIINDVMKKKIYVQQSHIPLSWHVTGTPL